ncbi:MULTISPECIES: hypothetical protein [Streptosporangiaceae]|uniref:Uncharacterized protein n=2 Tax=Streptosporangiales TaxID=85012 RepID=A0A7W7S5J4_9ACTN|nr:hypothetical protein [Streptosporangium album]MBB4944275.1 hypothetical protein [Streptosporangium album]
MFPQEPILPLSDNTALSDKLGGSAKTRTTGARTCGSVAIAIGMLTGAVVVGVNGQLWLAALLTGPSLIALAKIFVLRRSDATDMKQLQAQRDAVTAPPLV